MVRNSEELGPILFTVAKSLASDQKLCKYLANTDKNPLDCEDIDGFSLIHKNIVLVPEINKNDFNTASKVCIIISNGDVQDNKQFKEIYLDFIVYTPLRSWIINELNLRPFSIMGCIERIIKGYKIESLGPAKYHGFSITTVDDNLSAYTMRFTLDVYN